MFGWLKKSQPAAPTKYLGDTLFGDGPVEAWPPNDDLLDEPWGHFVRARRQLQASDTASAINLWRAVTEMPDLESRHYLQAWNFLRAHGIQCPDAIAKQVLGVVVEVHLPDGLDLLAAYPEHTARYYNHSGSGVVWERPDASLDESIDRLLAPAAEVAAVIGPWEEPRRGAPPRGEVRLNILTPSGLHFGQGELNSFFQDRLAAPPLMAATQLMQALIEKQTN